MRMPSGLQRGWPSSAGPDVRRRAAPDSRSITPQLARAVVGEAGAVELVEEPVDLADVRVGHGLWCFARLAAPRSSAALTTHSERPSGLQAMSVTSRGSRVSWRASPPSMGSSQTWRAAFLGCLGGGRPIGGASRLEDRRAVAQEGEAPSIGAPAGRGVAASTEGQRTRRASSRRRARSRARADSRRASGHWSGR